MSTSRGSKLPAALLDDLVGHLLNKDEKINNDVPFSCGRAGGPFEHHDVIAVEAIGH